MALLFIITVPNPMLAEYKTHLLDIYNKSLDDETVSVQLLGLNGIHAVLSMPNNHMTEEEVTTVTSKLVNKAVLVESEQEIRLGIS